MMSPLAIVPHAQHVAQRIPDSSRPTAHLDVREGIEQRAQA
jgi:hypothetical protein